MARLTTIFFLLFIFSTTAFSQRQYATLDIRLKPVLDGVTVKVLREDSTHYLNAMTDSTGSCKVSLEAPGVYILKISSVGFQSQIHRMEISGATEHALKVEMMPVAAVLGDVTVTAKKPFVQQLPDKTVINVEAGITNTGASILEVIEKSPGVTVDKDGNISLKGRPGVQVMIDGKLTQLAGSDLQNYLNGMNASQVDQIELIDNPSAKYDAAGNAGIINIRLKKNRQRGFNGSVTAGYGQGRYPKSNNNFLFNYRTGKLNLFLNYNYNVVRYVMDMYALRTYYEQDETTVSARLEQPYFTKGKGQTHTLRTGADYALGKRTTAGITFTGTFLTRKNNGRSTARWLSPAGDVDSVINTATTNDTRLEQGGINLNLQHTFESKAQLTADVDFVKYDIETNQYFQNKLSGGTASDASLGNIPTALDIFSAKADYSQSFGSVNFEAGLKTSRVETDNLADYAYDIGGGWVPDLGKSNHFIYTENIHAAYANLQTRQGRWEIQAGLRSEYTAYKASQLGNAVTKDSSFNRKYHSLFPTIFITYEADSLNSFTLRGGRRIDRPAFQKLNPFVFIINKYTLQTGNPYFLPQYTWNIELTHRFKDIINTGISYNYTNDYFSQVFISDTATGLIVYTEGNVGHMRNIGFTAGLNIAPAKWWNLSAQAVLNTKHIEGQLWKAYTANITQANFSINNQLRFKKGWGAELSGFFITKNQNDLQEVLEPTGQVSAGLSKQVLKNKGSLRLTVRDIFYTQAMAGWTDFQGVKEYFKLKRDTQVATITFTYRFGKPAKQQARRGGGAGDVMERVGTVN